MKRLILAAFAAGLLAFAITSCENPADPPRKEPPGKELPDPPKEEEPVDIEAILSSMSTEQKIRQMVQVRKPRASSEDGGDPGSLSNQWYGSVGRY